MYFGILGNRWIQERPDILTLNWNETIATRKSHYSTYSK